MNEQKNSIPSAKLISHVLIDFSSEAEMELFINYVEKTGSNFYENMKKIGLMRFRLNQVWNKEGGFALSTLFEYKDENDEKLIVETTTSWCFVGPGLRLSMELFGPEYSMFVNTLDTDLKVFFSREVSNHQGEDLVEKQNAESGQMPVVSSEADVYGYTAENRHMVECFLKGVRPKENFSDGVAITELLMTAYMSAEQGVTIKFPPPDLDQFVPMVAKGKWNPKKQ